MELVLTHLKDFSCKSATFNDSSSTAELQLFHRNSGEERNRKLDIESSLAWLKKELMEMRYLDQMLVKQLMELHAGIQELKLEYCDMNDLGSDSETDSICSSTGDGCPSPLSINSTFYVTSRRTFCRRSSMP
ncbi:protein FAM167A-like [Protopterus annectens]|uniref:protein FAM167A-like n=1 Tax=Protopterus annectens TaxID=7888 RepID=UPI001CFBF1BD|nr:protein FAM167A-like [Protopterus annectens]